MLFEICRCFDRIIIGLTASATGLRSIARRRRFPAAKAVATASLDFMKSGDWRGISGAASTSQGWSRTCSIVNLSSEGWNSFYVNLKSKFTLINCEEAPNKIFCIVRNHFPFFPWKLKFSKLNSFFHNPINTLSGWMWWEKWWISA